MSFGSQGAAQLLPPPAPLVPPPPLGAPPPPLDRQELPDLVKPELQLKSHSVPLQVLVEFAGGDGHTVHTLSCEPQPTPGLGRMHTPPHIFLPEPQEPPVPPLDVPPLAVPPLDVPPLELSLIHISEPTRPY